MVERTFSLLDLLSVSEEGLTFSDLARALSMSKGSLHGLLKTLERARVIEQTEERRYVIGPRVGDLARAHDQRAGLRRFALPAMRRLAAELGETVFLGCIEPDGVRVAECVEAEADRPSLHISAARGTRVPLLAAALGRLVLGTWPVARREEYLQTHPLPRFTERSTTDPQEFLASVERTMRTGIGEDREEYLAGVNAVAVPIYGRGSALVALLWVVGFATHLPEEAMAGAGQRLRAEAEAISRALGSV
jgi:DNA-binding IclR family transcriptional regulator